MPLSLYFLAIRVLTAFNHKSINFLRYSIAFVTENSITVFRDA